MCASFSTERKSEELLIESNIQESGKKSCHEVKGQPGQGPAAIRAPLTEQSSMRTVSGQGQAVKRGWPKRAGEINQD